MLVLVIAPACERERAPSGITCDALRSLKRGMPIAEVRRLLGPPARETRQTGNVVFDSRGADQSWRWEGPVRLSVEFRRGRLIQARSWIRTMWRDLFDNESRPMLFRLQEDGSVVEGADFERVYCPR